MPDIVILTAGMPALGAAHDGFSWALARLLLSTGSEIVELAGQYFRVDSDLRRR